MAYRDEVLADSPYAYYRLQETSGTTAVSETGSNNGTYSGTYTLNQSGHPSMAGDLAVLFGGGKIASPLSGGPTTTATLEAVVYIPDTSEYGAFINLGNGTNGYGVGVGNGEFGSDRVGNGLAVLFEGVAWINTGYLLGTGWKHIVVTMNNATLVAYVNGTQVYSGSHTGIKTPTGDVTVANSPVAGRSFLNPVSEAAVYPTVLSAARVQAHYDALVAVAADAHLVAQGSAGATGGATLTVNEVHLTAQGSAGAADGASLRVAGPYHLVAQGSAGATGRATLTAADLSLRANSSAGATSAATLTVRAAVHLVAQGSAGAAGEAWLFETDETVTVAAIISSSPLVTEVVETNTVTWYGPNGDVIRYTVAHDAEFFIEGADGFGLVTPQYESAKAPGQRGETLRAMVEPPRDVALTTVLDGGSYRGTDALRRRVVAAFNPRGGFGVLRYVGPNGAIRELHNVTYLEGLGFDEGQSKAHVLPMVIRLRAWEPDWQDLSGRRYAGV